MSSGISGMMFHLADLIRHAMAFSLSVLSTFKLRTAVYATEKRTTMSMAPVSLCSSFRYLGHGHLAIYYSLVNLFSSSFPGGVQQCRYDVTYLQTEKLHSLSLPVSLSLPLPLPLPLSLFLLTSPILPLFLSVSEAVCLFLYLSSCTFVYQNAIKERLVAVGLSFL